LLLNVNVYLCQNVERTRLKRLDIHMTNLQESIQLLKKIIKNSTATDQFLHIDLSLVAADQRAIYQEALKTTYKAVLKGEITREDVNRLIFE